MQESLFLDGEIEATGIIAADESAKRRTQRAYSDNLVETAAISSTNAEKVGIDNASLNADIYAKRDMKRFEDSARKGKAAIVCADRLATLEKACAGWLALYSEGESNGGNEPEDSPARVEELRELTRKGLGG